MERLIIYLHRNVNNSKFIKKNISPEIRPAPPLNLADTSRKQVGYVSTNSGLHFVIRVLKCTNVGLILMPISDEQVD